MMARRIRKQVSITPEQDQTVRRLAAEGGVSQSAIICGLLTNYVSMTVFPKSDLAAWEREVAFIVQWMGEGSAEGGRTWRREELYER